ncbi:hypothetical protein GW17_00031822 [Ensete ventricosum]|nr:hypothetical protein GW17_00031822 [Ensete ventricosum]
MDHVKFPWLFPSLWLYRSRAARRSLTFSLASSHGDKEAASACPGGGGAGGRGGISDNKAMAAPNPVSGQHKVSFLTRGFLYPPPYLLRLLFGAREVMGEQHMNRFLTILDSVVRRANGLPEKLYTLKPIKTKDQNLVQISIIDTTTGKRVTSGPWSSVKVEVLALHGDFNCDGQKRWTKDEFNNHIVVAREGKGPLLTGKLVIQLTDGVGYLDNVSFSDNSIWTRSNKFRLAVRLYKAEGAQEGISEPLRVKDCRGQCESTFCQPFSLL